MKEDRCDGFPSSARVGRVVCGYDLARGAPARRPRGGPLRGRERPAPVAPPGRPRDATRAARGRGPRRHAEAAKTRARAATGLATQRRTAALLPHGDGVGDLIPNAAPDAPADAVGVCHRGGFPSIDGKSRRGRREAPSLTKRRGGRSGAGGGGLYGRVSTTGTAAGPDSAEVIA